MIYNQKFHVFVKSEFKPSNLKSRIQPRKTLYLKGSFVDVFLALVQQAQKFDISKKLP